MTCEGTLDFSLILTKEQVLNGEITNDISDNHSYGLLWLAVMGVSAQYELIEVYRNLPKLGDSTFVVY